MKRIAITWMLAAGILAALLPALRVHAARQVSVLIPVSLEDETDDAGKWFVLRDRSGTESDRQLQLAPGGQGVFALAFDEPGTREYLMFARGADGGPAYRVTVSVFCGESGALSAALTVWNEDGEKVSGAVFGTKSGKTSAVELSEEPAAADHEPVRTGDPSNGTLWLLTAAAALTLSFAAGRRLRRDTNERRYHE